MRRLAAALLCVVAQAGCTSVDQTHGPATRLTCENGETVEARYAGDVALITYKNRQHRMRTALSASGARYVGDGLEWWTKGLEEGTIAVVPPGQDVSSGERIACRAGSPP